MNTYCAPLLPTRIYVAVGIPHPSPSFWPRITTDPEQARRDECSHQSGPRARLYRSNHALCTDPIWGFWLREVVASTDGWDPM